MIPATISATRSGNIVDQAVVSSAIGILSGLVKASRALLPAVLAHGTEVLLSSLDVESDAKQQSRVLELLGGTTDTKLACSVARAAVRAMAAFPQNRKVQMTGCDVLHSCARLVPPRHLQEAGCGPVVTSAVQLCKGVPVLQRNGWSVLRAISSDADGFGLEAVSVCAAAQGALVPSCSKVPGLLGDVVAVLTAAVRGSCEARAAVKGAGVAAAVAGTAEKAGAEPCLTAGVEALLRLVEGEGLA